MHNDAMTQADLMPSQNAALSGLESALERSTYVALVGRSGTGKTAIAQVLVRRHGATLIDFNSCLDLGPDVPADRWNERVAAMLEEALAGADMLVLDDFDWMVSTIDTAWPIMAQAKAELMACCERTGKRLVMVGRTEIPAREYEIEEERERLYIAECYGGDTTTPVIALPHYLTPEDMRFLAERHLNTTLQEVDFEVIYTRVGQLLPRQLLLALDLAALDGPITTRTLARAVAACGQGGNVDLSDVEAVSFDLLPGSEEIAAALETHVAMPFEHPEEAKALGFNARRGVMLFGPPGTGKTSIGRALAHRLKGKFFLIDGSIPTEPPHLFIARVEAIIERAIKNSPSVLFIDDADSLFSIPYVAGVVRKLLSLMDGIESATASQVCVMLTVMDPSRVPDALLRSGRVELWLETLPPDEETRARIFGRWSAPSLGSEAEFDCSALAARSSGFTPADIRRVIEDAKLLHARDVSRGAAPSKPSEYALRAIDEVVAMRAKMSVILHDKSLRIGTLEEMAA